MVCFLLDSFLYIQLNKGGIKMIIGDIDDFIFADEEVYVSER